MKKISILFAALVMIMAAGFNTINAQRVWAYGLTLSQEGTSYHFAFTAVADATEANLVFTTADGTEVGKVPIKNVKQGANTFTLTEEEIPGKDVILHWAVELKGAAIEALTEVTDVDKGIYNFYLPQGVATDNNPGSKNFGMIYIAEATDGANDGASARTKAQKRGVFTYDPLLNELNTENVGFVPANITLTDASRQAIHRIAVRPTDGLVAFAYNVAPTAVWTVPATGDAVNLIDGITEITLANSLCFDEKGVLYVLDNANTDAGGGTIYKVENGAATKIIQSAVWGNADNAIVPDGRGGIWVAQHRYAIDAYNLLTHVNAKGEIDYAVNSSADAAITGLFYLDSNIPVSYRGQMAYDTQRDVLAFGGNKQVTLFDVTYDAETGVPTLTKGIQTPVMGNNIDGVAFDYAGDLLVVSATKERFYKYAIPTTDNHIVVPAQSSQTITKGAGTFVDNTSAVMPQAHKVIRNGQVYIVRDNKVYNIMGQAIAE